jgi:hypothetical protein
MDRRFNTAGGMRICFFRHVGECQQKTIDGLRPSFSAQVRFANLGHPSFWSAPYCLTF